MATIKTRKMCRAGRGDDCDDCGRQINPGTSYWYTVTVDDRGVIHPWRSHRGCDAIRVTYMTQHSHSGDGFDEGWLVSNYEPGDLTRAQIDRALSDVDDVERERVLALLGID